MAEWKKLQSGSPYPEQDLNILGSWYPTPYNEHKIAAMRVPNSPLMPQPDILGINQALQGSMGNIPMAEGMLPESQARSAPFINPSPAVVPDDSNMPYKTPPPKKAVNKYNKDQEKLAKELQKQEEDRYKKYMDMREKLIENSQQRAKLLNEGYTPQMDLSALASLTDAWTGSNFARSYKRPETFEDRQRLLEAIEGRQQQQLGSMVSADQRERMMEMNKKLKSDLAKVKADSKGKILTATETGQLADIKSQETTLSALYKNWQDTFKNESRFGGWLSSKVYGTEADKYDDQRKLAAQAIGKALEGGKLTDVDYNKYLNMLPSAGDTKDQAEKKMKNLREVLQNKYRNSIDSFGKAGYDVSGFNEPLSGINKQAMNWLQQNPDHPKAAAVRAKLGI